MNPISVQKKQPQILIIPFPHNPTATTFTQSHLSITIPFSHNPPVTKFTQSPLRITIPFPHNPQSQNSHNHHSVSQSLFHTTHNHNMHTITTQYHIPFSTQPTITTCTQSTLSITFPFPHNPQSQHSHNHHSVSQSLFHTTHNHNIHRITTQFHNPFSTQPTITTLTQSPLSITIPFLHNPQSQHSHNHFSVSQSLFHTTHNHNIHTITTQYHNPFSTQPTITTFTQSPLSIAIPVPQNPQSQHSHNHHSVSQSLFHTTHNHNTHTITT
jgi:hypothetical protein